MINLIYSLSGKHEKMFADIKQKFPNLQFRDFIMSGLSESLGELSPFVHFPFSSLPEGFSQEVCWENIRQILLENGMQEGKIDCRPSKIPQEVIAEAERQQSKDNLIFNTPDKVLSIKNPIDPRFYEASLLGGIYLELNKDHKLDIREKLAVFLISLTAELKDPRDHCSAALKGNSATGKDNVILSCFKHFPQDESFFLTTGTKAAIEDEAGKVRRIAFSEINKNRENGANAEITELFKQMSEGGLFSIKKDPISGYKLTKYTKQEQKTLLYGTTESDNDDELETRYVVISIRGSYEKNQIVVNDSLQKVRNEEYILQKIKQPNSWIAESIKNLDHEIHVLIPYTEIFEKPIMDIDGKEKYLFDYAKDRIKRDAKRLLSITKAIAWLYQKQRQIVVKDGVKFLYAEPSDFLTAINIFAGFFNLTYVGLDHRLLRTFEQINSLVGKHKEEIKQLGFPDIYSDWVLRHLLQESLGIESVNTIKAHIDGLKDSGRVETFYDRGINQKAYLIRPINSPINKVSLPVSLTAIDRSLTDWLIDNKLYNKEIKPIDLGIIPEFQANYKHISEKLTCQKLTGQFSQGLTLIELIKNSGEGNPKKLEIETVKLAGFSDLDIQKAKDRYEVFESPYGFLQVL